MHQMFPELAALYLPDDKSISVMVGSQKVRMRVKLTMDEDYLDEHVFVLRTIDRDGNGQWNNNRALTLFVHLFYLTRASEYEVCEIIRWQLYRQGFSVARVIVPKLHQSIPANLSRHEFTLFVGHLPALPTTSSQQVLPSVSIKVRQNGANYSKTACFCVIC